jgi:hypothetical protein
MNSTLGYVILFLYCACSASIVACRPDWFDDQNRFLKEFVTYNFLSLLGVILAITLASIANIHLEFNKIEERYKNRGLAISRQNLRSNAHWLISSFVCGVLIVLVKPIAVSGTTSEAFFNAAAMLILLIHVLILISLTQLIFAIEPDV